MKYTITVFWDEQSARYAQEHGVEKALIDSEGPIGRDWSVSVYGFKTKDEVDMFRMGVAEAGAYSTGEHYMADTKEI